MTSPFVLQADTIIFKDQAFDWFAIDLDLLFFDIW